MRACVTCAHRHACRIYQWGPQEGSVMCVLHLPPGHVCAAPSSLTLADMIFLHQGQRPALPCAGPRCTVESYMPNWPTLRPLIGLCPRPRPLAANYADFVRTRPRSKHPALSGGLVHCTGDTELFRITFTAIALHQQLQCPPRMSRQSCQQPPVQT